MYIRCSKIVKWGMALPGKLIGCGLCGRRFEAGEKCLCATWLSESGFFQQGYHPACAEVVRVWGYPAKTVSPADCEKWAMKIACERCDKNVSCPTYVFDCRAALSRLLFAGGAQEETKPAQEEAKPAQAPKQEEPPKEVLAVINRKAYQKARRERLKAAGLCTVCAREAPVFGEVRCENCKRRYAECKARREKERKEAEKNGQPQAQ